MSGNDSPRSFARRYLAVDGGAGAHLLASLGRIDPRLRPVATPRHADLFVVIEPVSRKLAPAVLAGLARAMPRPAQALLVGDPERNELGGADLARVERLFPGARRITSQSACQIFAAALTPSDWPKLTVADASAIEPTTIPLPPRQEREIATEMAVLSLGPIQPFTAGPLRLLLVCDGEQVLSAQVEAGYARRGIAEAMMKATWREATDLVRRLDPLAPVAGQLVYVRALEQLQSWRPPPVVAKYRDAALALERAQNRLWWLVRFADGLAARRMADQAYQLAAALNSVAARLWPDPPQAWIVPQGHPGQAAAAAVSALEPIATQAEALRARVERDRLLGLRTRGVGILPAERLEAAGVSGPVLAASADGAGDVHARLVTRLEFAATDLRQAAQVLLEREPDGRGAACWEVPAGEAQRAVDGPRGRLGLTLVSEGGDGPVRAEWQRPSAVLLGLLPELLPGQKLADAEVTVASLDLSMAEADG